MLSPGKMIPPTNRIEWLGILLDTITMQSTIPFAKLSQVLTECAAWMERQTTTRRDTQQLVGKLAFISQCIPPARTYMAHILASLRGMPPTAAVAVNAGLLLDVEWFLKYATRSNGCRFLEEARPLIHIRCDACPAAAGGWSPTTRKFYNFRFKATFSATHPIHQGEAVNGVVALKTLVPPSAAGTRVIISTDNKPTKDAYDAGITKDMFLAACNREIKLFQAVHDVEVVVVHVPGSSLVLADALSRAFTEPRKACIAERLINDLNLKFVIPKDLEYVLSPT